MPPSIQEVKQKHEARLLAIPGVVAIGIGLDKDGDLAIIVSLDGAYPETQAQLPRSLEGYTVSTQITGKLKAY